YVLVRIPRPPGSTLFPYTTLFRSGREVGLVGRKDVATRVPQRRITQHGKVLDRDPAVPGARGADGVEGRVFRRGRLHGLDELGVHRPVVRAAALDRILPHAVDVVEQRLAVARGVVEDGPVGGDRVLDRLPEVPPLRLDG